MHRLYKHIIQLLAVLAVIFLHACGHDEEFQPGGNGHADETVQLELFTRAVTYNTPVVRATANEDIIERTPWVLVFQGSDNQATLTEASQAYEIGNKIYVNLTLSNVDSRLLVLANTRNLTATLLETWTGKSLLEISNLFLTVPLANPQPEVPYVGTTIPMSYLLDVAGGIKTSTTIGTVTNPLELIRPVAKVVVRSTATDFTLLGITEVNNVPDKGQIHNLAATPATGIANLISYQKSGQDIVVATANSTANNPVYLYESDKNNHSHIIIRGTYKGKTGYYKMAFADTQCNSVHIVRNHHYTYVITKVEVEGHPTVQEARNAPAYNTELHVSLIATDASAYETTAYADYYLSLSNSRYIAYSNTSGPFDILTYLPYKENGTVKGTIKPHSGLGLVLPASSGFTSTNTMQDMRMTINSIGNAEAEIKLGNLKTSIHIKREAALSPDEHVLKYYTKDPVGNWDNFVYYLLSGEVADGKEWIELTPGTGIVRDDKHNIVVDDGKIHINIKANVGTVARTGTVFLTKARNPGWTGDPGLVFRIKIDITQLAN